MTTNKRTFIIKVTRFPESSLQFKKYSLYNQIHTKTLYVFKQYLSKSYTIGLF